MPAQQPATTYLADSNILQRAAQFDHPLHPIVRAALENIAANDDQIVIVPQTLWEFYAVATRPKSARDGFGWTPADAKKIMDKFRSEYPVRTCSEKTLLDEWERLVQTYNTQGLPAHDARLVAAMKVHGVTHLLTFNEKDFNRYAAEGIIIVNPAGVPAPIQGAKTP